MIDDIQTLKKLYFSMLRIRRIEEAIATHYGEQKMRTPVHLSIGQETVAAIVGMQLATTDYAISTHRAHAHYFAKGGSLNAMIAELHGKVTGCCRGRGGSMHLIDQSVGFMGSTAIVGNTIPVGVGLGLASQLENKGRISCVFVGDGAVEEGVFFESINFAILKKLPVLFICENNRYSVYSHFNKRQPATRHIHEMVRAMGATAAAFDGYDALACYEGVKDAIRAIRAGNGTYFLEFETYRWLEHCGPFYDNHIGYRTEEEFLSWKQRDPLETFKSFLCVAHQMSALEFQAMETKISEEIVAAFQFADVSPFPDPIEAITGQYQETSTQEELVYA